MRSTLTKWQAKLIDRIESAKCERDLDTANGYRLALRDMGKLSAEESTIMYKLIIAINAAVKDAA